MLSATSAPNPFNPYLHPEISPLHVPDNHLLPRSIVSIPIRNERIALWRRSISGPGSLIQEREEDVKSQTSGAGPSTSIEKRREILLEGAA